MRVSNKIRQWFMLLSATLLVAGSLSIIPVFDAISSPDLAEAAATSVTYGGAKFTINYINMSPTEGAQNSNPLGSGDTFTYEVGWSCDALEGASPGGNDGLCNGATLEFDNLTFTNIFGNQQGLEYVSGSIQAGGGGPTPFVNNPDGVGKWVLSAAELNSGTTGSFIFSFKIPAGTVPAEKQTITPAGKVTLGESSADYEGVPKPTIQGKGSASTLSKKSNPSNRVVLGLTTSAPVTYTISVCPEPGKTLNSSYKIEDSLPPGAEIVSGSISNGGTAADRVITWDLFTVPSPDPVTGCFDLTYQLSYPNTPGTNETGHAKGSNDASLTWKENSVVGYVDGETESPSLGPVTQEIQLIAPPVGTTVGKSAGNNYYVHAGDEITYSLSFKNTGHEDTQALTKATMTDGPLPAQFGLTEIRTGVWDALGDSGTAQIEVSTDGANTWSSVTSTENASITSSEFTNIAEVTHVRWTFSGEIPVGWEATGQKLVGTIQEVGEGIPADEFKNCVGTISNSPEQANDVTSQRCVELYLDDGVGPHPYLQKATPGPSSAPPGITPAPNNLLPGETITYTLGLRNLPDATGPLTNPVITDCVPASQYLSVEDIRLATTSGVGTWSQVEPPNSLPCDGNTTRIEFQLDGSLQPGDEAPVIEYDVKAQGFESGTEKVPTPPGPYKNQARVKSTDTPIQHCATSPSVGAGVAADDDGACGVEHTVTVPHFSYLRSQKLVKGALDTDYNADGTTTPGGQVTWQLTVQNIGNTAAGSVTLIDILPHVGDTGVRLSDQARNSQFAPVLVSPITAQDNWNIEYSKSANPCRQDDLAMGSEAAGCETPNWTSSPDLSQLSTYRSLRLTYKNYLDIGDEATFEFNMATPVTDGAYDDLESCLVAQAGFPEAGNGNTTMDSDRQSTEPTCPVAYNSFAYGVLPMGATTNKLGAEPVKVAIRVAEATGEAETKAGIGDRVWYDMDRDGIQNTDPDTGVFTEPGVPDVRVELIDEADKVVAVTFTDANGLYLFTTDSDGNKLQPEERYTVRFYPPAGYEVTYQNVAEDTSASEFDSDVPQTKSGTNDIGDYHDTVLVPGLPEGFDLTWDMGIWGGDLAEITIDKVTKDSAWPDSAAGDGTAVHVDNDEIVIAQGRPVTWIYEIENTGLTRLENVTLTDDHGGLSPSWADDDFECEISFDGLNAFDVESNADLDEGPRSLNRGAQMRCTIEIEANEVEAGTHYHNLAGVVGTPNLDNGNDAFDVDGEPLENVADDDPSSYYSLAQRFAVGDYVWFDLNHNGIQDPSETGVAGVTVELLSENSGWVTRTTTTDSNGLYLFDDVPAGKYRVRFSNIPSGYEFTNTTVGANVSVDSDADLSGLTAEFEVGVTAPNNRSVTASDRALYVGGAIELGAATTIINPTIDAGIWLPTPNVGISKQAEIHKVESGMSVTWTLKVRNTGTGAANGVVVVDTLPEGLDFQSGLTGPTPTYDPNTREVTWIIPSVAPGETVTITYTTLVTAPGGTKLTNSAVIAGNDEDPDGRDDDTIEVEVDDSGVEPDPEPIPPTTVPKVDADDTDRPRLPFTGSNIATLGTLAAALLGLGVALATSSRRRRRTA